MAWPGPHEDGATARFLGGLKVAWLIAHHGCVFKRAAECFFGLTEQARFWLSTRAAVIGVVGAEEDSCDFAARVLDGSQEFGMHGLKGGEIEESATHRRLVGQDHHTQARRAKTSYGLRATRDGNPIVWAEYVGTRVLLVDHPVSIEEHPAKGLASGCAGGRKRGRLGLHEDS